MAEDEPLTEAEAFATDLLKQLPEDRRRRFIDGPDGAYVETLLGHWRPRDEQCPPAGDWRVWLLLAGYSEPTQDVVPSSVALFVADWEGNQLQYPSPRTNYLLQSAGIANTSFWADTNVTVASAAGTDPTGNNNALFLAETAVNGLHDVTQAPASVPTSTAVTVSIYLKANQRSIAELLLTGHDGTVTSAYFTLSGAGSVAAGDGTPLATAIVAMASGWYRCSLTQNSGSGSTTLRVNIRPSLSGSDGGTYQGVAGDGIYLWGAQLEAAPGPTSYIPTGNTSLTTTDYTLVADANWGLTYGVEFADAPAQDAVVSANFNYTWPCRFDDDSAEFSNFMFNFWELKKIGFTTMKVV